MNKFVCGAAALAFLLLFSKCLVVDNAYTGLPPGTWRGVLKLVNTPITPNPKGKPLPEKLNMTFDEVTEGELPFNFEVKYIDEHKFYIEIKNGDEIIRVDDITIGRDRTRAKDTIFIAFPVYDSYIHGIFEENIIEGEWVVSNKENYRIPFIARHGKGYRFTTLKKEPVTDISGRWEAMFGLDEEKPYPAIGEFKQEGNYLTGTFLTETGDYRYLEGTIQHDKIYLSCFDGSHAFLFEAKIKGDSLEGVYRSGHRYRTLWTARRNSEARLTDPHKLTFLKPGYERFDFAFPNADGKTIALSDPAYKGKVTLVQIMGTWCPNCRDETSFLMDYRRSHADAGLATVALAFERHKDPEKARHALRTYREKMGLDYEVLLAGNSDKEAASKALPMLNAVVSFPTLIILDKKGKVRQIHTGFSGPATSEFESFKRSFDELVQQLLSEPQ